MQGEDQTAVQMVKAGFGDSTGVGRCLHFTVGFNSRDEAYEAIREIGNYNRFDPERVISTLQEVCQPYSGFGAATGGPGLSVGREGSPCIYINKLCFTGPEDEQDAALKEACQILATDGLADEVDECSDGAGSSYGRTIRVWWD